MDVPKELRYSTEHEWVVVEDGIARVGITDYAQDQLGDVVYVELPEVETAVQKEEPFGVIESVKAASEIYAPVSGEVVEGNAGLEGDPALVNNAPLGDGWK